MSKFRLRVRGSMCRLSMIGWLIVGAVAGSIDGEDAVDRDLAGFDGTWRMVSLTVNGKQVDPKKLATLRFEILSGNISTRRSGIEVAKSSFTVDASKSPMQFEVVRKDKLGQQVGKGIYKLEGHELIWCEAPAGHDPPTAFESKEGSPVTLVMFQKVVSD